MSMRGDQEKYKAWLATLQAGDEVAVTRNSWGGTGFDILKIERLTATQFVTSGDIRYRRESGSVVGDGYSRLAPVTPEVRADIEHRKLVEWLSSLTRHHRVIASLEQLRAMKTAYDEVSK